MKTKQVPKQPSAAGGQKPPTPAVPLRQHYQLAAGGKK
jgi:hypothetical protein